MNINGVEIDFNFYDAETAERYQKAFEVFSESEVAEGGNLPEVIRDKCKLFDILFDSIFGEGTAIKLFGEKKDLIARFDATESLFEETKRQSKEVEQRKAKFSTKKIKK